MTPSGTPALLMFRAAPRRVSWIMRKATRRMTFPCAFLSSRPRPAATQALTQARRKSRTGFPALWKT